MSNDEALEAAANAAWMALGSVAYEVLRLGQGAPISAWLYDAASTANRLAGAATNGELPPTEQQSVEPSK